MVVGSVVRGERNDRVGQWILSPVVRRAAVVEVGGTPLFDASERPHRRQDNLRGSIANSLLVKLAAYNPGGRVRRRQQRIQTQKTARPICHQVTL